MKRYRVEHFPEVDGALREAATHIRDQSGPTKAKNWLNGILKAIDRFEKLPTAHAVVTIHDGRPVHSMLVRPDRGYYVIDELSSTVYVIDVVHTARDTKLRKYRPR